MTAKDPGGPLAAAPDAALVPLDRALRERLDLPTYRAILAVPTWGVITEALVATRLYERGLEAGFRLLQFAETHAEYLDRQEVDRHRQLLSLFILDMLDRLDDWEAYLDVWAALRARPDLTLTYHARAERATTAIAPYILGREAETLRVHLLWLTDWRKQVIERKVAARARGWKLGNRRHHPPSALSDAERRRRLARILAWARALSRNGAGQADETSGPSSPERPAGDGPGSAGVSRCAW